MEHLGSLFAQLYAVCQYHDLFSRTLDEPSGDFGKHDRFATTGGQLVKDVGARGQLIQMPEDLAEIFLLVIVQCFLTDFFLYLQGKNGL